MATLDKKTLRLNIGNLSEIKSAALEIAESKLEDERKQFLNEFESHSVTEEIDAGESSENTSGTLGGYGNLFSFIGFNSGSKPTEVVKNLISKIRIIGSGKSEKGKPYGQVIFKVLVPSMDEFENKTPMPWAAGRSWLTGIERGISGLGYFISRSNSGRSGGGVQSDNKIRSGTFKNTSYFSRMYNNFLKRLFSVNK
jgi:hypothetical protein